MALVVLAVPLVRAALAEPMPRVPASVCVAAADRVLASGLHVQSGNGYAKPCVGGDRVVVREQVDSFVGVIARPGLSGVLEKPGFLRDAAGALGFATLAFYLVINVRQLLRRVPLFSAS